MSTPLYPPSRPLSIAEELDFGFRLFNLTLFRCLPYSVLAMIAQQLSTFYEMATGRTPGLFGGGDPVWWLLYVIGGVLTLGLWNAMMLRQITLASGKQVSTSDEVRLALRRLPIVVLLLLVWVLGTALGLALLVVPGLYLSIALVFAWPALVLKPELSLIGSIRYSLRLARRNWWRTSTVFSVALVVLFVFYAVGIVFALLAAPLIGVADVAVATAISMRVLVAMGVFAVPFMSALLLASYADAEVRAESTPPNPAVNDAAPRSAT